MTDTTTPAPAADLPSPRALADAFKVIIRGMFSPDEIATIDAEQRKNDIDVGGGPFRISALDGRCNVGDAMVKALQSLGVDVPPAGFDGGAPQSLTLLAYALATWEGFSETLLPGFDQKEDLAAYFETLAKTERETMALCTTPKRREYYRGRAEAYTFSATMIRQSLK